MWHRTFKTLIFFIITTRLQTTSFNCPSDLKRCTCKLINGTYQIVCDKVLFKIYNNMLTFQCRQMEMNYFEETPKLDTRNIKKVNIYDCPMPLYNSLNYFVNKLNTSALESFQFISFEANAGRTISPNIFEGLQNISTIHLSLNENIKFSSELITIPSNITITTKQLNFQVRLTREAVLFNCMTNEDQNITSFPNMNVLNNNVKVLQISHCNVAKDYSFNDIVTKLNLENINQLLLIDVNMRTNYSFENFKHLEYLKSLTFQNHISQHFSLGFIKHLHHLEDIIFRDLHDDVFSSMNTLSTLHLSNNKIAKIPDKHFEGQIVLETINMTNNRLEYFDTTSIVNLTLLSVLDLRDNNIKRIDFNIKHECKCMVRAADQTLIVNCSNLNLIELPSLPNITNLKLNKIELIIDNNNITKLPSHTFPFYNAVSKLIAFNNQISDLHLDNIPILLQTLELKNNKLTFFDTNVVNVFKEIKILSLSDNSWNCECSSIDFLNFVKEYRANITDFNNLKCFDGQMMSELETDDLCFNYLLLAVILTVISTIIGIIAAIYYKFKIEIKIWLFAHNCCLWWVSEEELDRDMIYDAFIVFATPDQTMVEELVLGLESCKTPYKCCVHIRDWPPGEMIVTQVHNSIRDSRRTIVVLSPHFRESRWARFELRVALLNAFDEKRSRVIIVLNGELNDIDDMDEDLELYLKLNTYIKWTDKWFWSKLKYAMPHTQKALKFNKAKQKDEEIELQTEML
ncbi:unnamed protein product [Diamesa serratosioi]